MASRYYLTAQAARRLKTTPAVARRILRAAKIRPIGTMPRAEGEGGAPVLVWSAAEVECLRSRRGTMSSTHRRIQTNIRRGIAHRRAKRDALA